MTDPRIHPGQMLVGPLFNEPMRVETVLDGGGGTLTLGLVGSQTERFRKVSLSNADLDGLTIHDTDFRYDGDGALLRLGLQAYALGIAWEFDPYFGLSISRVDPLPHQLEAVYDYLLKLARVRFLLADDAGAGKTIMAGLLIRELQLRGLAERILIVGPANLAFQWQRELKEKFDERFLVLKGSDLRDQFGVNQWMEQKKVITSLDLAKREDILPGLRQVHWDLVIVDEAHRMSARDETHKSMRYRLGELLRDTSDHYLLLTATPHKGDPVNFTLFLQLLDHDAYADVRSIQQAMNRQHAPFYLRRTKEAMVYFPQRSDDGTWEARKIFTRRIPNTVGFTIDGEEFELYREVTRFVKRQCARAAAEGDDPRARAVGFLMALYQRRLASSTRAMRCSLENRAKRLDKGLEQAQDLARAAPPDLPDWEEIEEMEEGEREQLERMLEAVTLAGNADRVRQEIVELHELAKEAEGVELSGAEAKLGDADLEDRLLKDVDEGHFRNICQNALEGLAAKKLNLEMLIERRARARERRLVPESIARFIRDAAGFVPLELKLIETLPHTFEPARTPGVLRRYEREDDWKLTELLQRTDEEIGRAATEVEEGKQGAEGRLAKAENRHAELLSRRERRRQELERQSALSLQAVERLTSVLVLPHPERESTEVKNLRPNLETERQAMEVVMEHERARGCQVADVSARNLGYDVTSLDTRSGEMRLIEVKGLAAATGTILWSPNEKRVAEDRRDCYWLYVVTSCGTAPTLQAPIHDPIQYDWHEVRKVQHYYLNVDAMTQPMQVREGQPGYGTDA